MNKIYQFLYRRWLPMLLLFFIVMRIIISLKIPLFAQGNAAADDYLYTIYAKNLLAGHWLGSFNSFTLVKSISFSFFLVFNYILGIPYRLALISFYLISLVILSYSLYKVSQNKALSCLTFIFLLYSPIMLHQENVQKIYRGGVLVSSTLFVIGAFIGLYASAKEKNKRIIFWSLISSLSLPFFYYVKEDSIWLMPFILMMTICTSITILIFQTHSFKIIFTRLFLTFLPIFSLILVTSLYKNTNYKYYGEYTITDRSGTYYENFLHDLLVIQESEKSGSNIWISRSAIKKAEKYSPTLKKYSHQINNSFTDYQNGKTKIYSGDMVFWELRNTFNNLYTHKNGKYANNYYKKVHFELLKAFNNGKLKKSSRFYLSPVSQGLKTSDILWFKNNTTKYLATMITYKYNNLSVDEATGSFTQILNMSQITHSPIIWPGTINTFFSKRSIEFVNFLQKHVTKLYQSTSKIIFIIGFLGILLLLFNTFLQVLNKNFNLLPLALVILSLLSSAFALFIGVEWFSKFLSMKKFYDYISCDIPIMQILEMVGCFFTFKILIAFLRTTISNKKNS